MPVAVIDGIATHYDTVGDGPPLLMVSPGGFEAKYANWAVQGNYRRLDLVGKLSQAFRCVLFDRREAGNSGGRLERVTWAHYVEQAHGLLDHLDIDRCYVIGGCVGASIAAGLAIAHPQQVAAQVLFSPAGGARYRLAQHARFATHEAYVAEHGLDGVVSLALASGAGFSTDSRVGPWAGVIRADPEFAAAYAAQDAQWYQTMINGLVRAMFDRDTVPGVEPEDLMGSMVPALVVPGRDVAHATSAAWYLHECLPHSELWDIDVKTDDPEKIADRIREFLLLSAVAGHALESGSD